MESPRYVLLMGPRASGKTTVGRQLAGRLDVPFLDLDEAVLARLAQRSVTRAWELLGEETWRVAEGAVLALELIDGAGGVIALGGGAPTYRLTREFMESRQASGEALVVYLECPVDELVRRLTEAPGDRPSLTGMGTVEEVESVLEAREPIYRELADLIQPAGGASPESIAEAIEAAIRRRSADGPSDACG